MPSMAAPAPRGATSPCSGRSPAGTHFKHGRGSAWCGDHMQITSWWLSHAASPPPLQPSSSITAQCSHKQRTCGGHHPQDLAQEEHARGGQQQHEAPCC